MGFIQGIGCTGDERDAASSGEEGNCDINRGGCLSSLGGTEKKGVVSSLGAIRKQGKPVC